MAQNKKKKALKVIAIILLNAIIISGIGIFLTAYYGLLGTYPKIKASEGQIRVACVGDSITYGNNVKNWFKNSYPIQLNNMLGDTYCVGNFGDSGRTAMATADFPYQNDAAYKSSIKFAPQIVIIMFGSNDSKTHNWRGKNEFKRQYTQLIDKYLALDSLQEMYICVPPATYKDKWNIQGHIINTDIAQAVREISAEKGLILVDIAAAMNNHPEFFADKVHPNKDGAKIFARTVYNVMTQ